MFKFETELTVNPAPHNQSNFNPKTRQVFKGAKEKAYIADLEVRLRAKINRIKFKKFGPQPIKVDYIFGFMPPQSWSKKESYQHLITRHTQHHHN
ncbi:hypothetical protein GCM10025879_19890 [Leuconostoc litchii]|uniref:hypothetical protein n=1 Tax=Leuconostoc litchii TaxID=1981069 RepID=UPI0023E8FF67|nr:hypothetical protein [Leuconostoc litchii]GMA70743.1 hypothetical protein GCM10025879_19890 [Leuconostoc litchii]